MLRPRKVAPELVSIAPTRVDAGQTVTLSGKHFAKDPADNTVLFGTLPGKVSAASASELKVVVPQEAKAQLAVTVETKGGRSAPVSLEVVPVATASAVDPDVGMPGQSVLIHGEGFSAQRVAVRFAGLPAASVEEVPGGLKVVVPQIALPEGSATTVTVETSGQPARSFPFILGRLPLLLEASPARGVIGERGHAQGSRLRPPGARERRHDRRPAGARALRDRDSTDRGRPRAAGRRDLAGFPDRRQRRRQLVERQHQLRLRARHDLGVRAALLPDAGDRVSGRGPRVRLDRARTGAAAGWRGRRGLDRRAGSRGRRRAQRGDRRGGHAARGHRAARAPRAGGGPGRRSETAAGGDRRRRQRLREAVVPAQRRAA